MTAVATAGTHAESGRLRLCASVPAQAEQEEQIAAPPRQGTHDAPVPAAECGSKGVRGPFGGASPRFAAATSAELDGTVPLIEAHRRSHAMGAAVVTGASLAACGIRPEACQAGGGGRVASLLHTPQRTPAGAG